MRFSLRSKVVTVVAAAGCLAAGIVVASPAQAASVPAASAAATLPVIDAPSAANEGVAAAIAREFGHDVVDDSKTTETSQVSALPDGSMRLVANSLPVRVKQAGKWVPVNTDLATASGVVAPAAASVPVQFSAGGSGPMAKVQTLTGEWITESWPYGDLPTPRLSGSTATYPSVLPGVDLKLTATVTGMSEVLVVKDAAAAADRRVTDLTLAIGGASILDAPDGSTVATASDGSTLTSSAPTWWDSSRPGADASGPAAGDTALPVAKSVTAGKVVLQARTVGESSKVTYPLYIDPDWNRGQSGFWYVDRGYPNTAFANGARPVQRAGHASVANSTDHVEHLTRAYWQMDTSGLVGKQIRDAQFSVTETYSGTCTPAGFSVYQLSPSLITGQTWNTSSPSAAWPGAFGSSNAAAGRSGCPGTPALGFGGPSAVAAVAAVASTGQPYMYVGVRADNEGLDTAYREFAQGASLTVTYNSVPGAPAAMQYASPSRICSTSSGSPTPIDGTQPIVLQATANDPDSALGQHMLTWFAVYGVGNPYSWATPTASQAAGPVSVSIAANALTTGAEYYWQAQTTDDLGAVGPISANCYFRIVTASPASPTITPTSTGSLIVGKPMTVTFGSASTDGVRLFAFWWVPDEDTTPTPPPVVTPIVPGGALPACGSSSGAVRFVCPDSGSLSASNVAVASVEKDSTLWVASYNDAGRVSIATGHYFDASADTDGVGTGEGHIWDTSTISSAATSVPDLNTTSGSSGPTTRQPMSDSLSLVDSDFDGIPTTMMSYTTSTPASLSEREAIDTKNSFTVSAWLYLSPTAATGVAHVALAEDGANGPAFTLGTNAAGNVSFCRTGQLAGSVSACAAGSSLHLGTWTLVTGVWDAVNQNLRVLQANSIVAQGVAPQNAPAADTSATGWFCVGGACDYNGTFTTTQHWEGQIFRPSAFPGVISAGQLQNLDNAISPNDDPPLDESIGQVIPIGCSSLITPQNMYDYSPNFGAISDWTPSDGTPSQNAVSWNGLACQWVWEDSQPEYLDISAANIRDRGTMAELQASAAASGIPVSGIGDSAYFQMVGGQGVIQVFSASYWLTFTYPWFEGGHDADPLPADVIANLSAL